MATYREIEIWQTGRTLVTHAYQFAEMLPTEELGGMTANLKAEALNIPASIAEGASKSNDRELLAGYRNAMGACARLVTLLNLSVDLNYVEAFQISELDEKINALELKLAALAGKLEADVFGVRRRGEGDRPGRDRGDRGDHFDRGPREPREGGEEGGFDRDRDARPPRREDRYSRDFRPYRSPDGDRGGPPRRDYAPRGQGGFAPRRRPDGPPRRPRY